MVVYNVDVFLILISLTRLQIYVRRKFFRCLTASTLFLYIPNLTVLFLE